MFTYTMLLCVLMHSNIKIKHIKRLSMNKDKLKKEIEELPDEPQVQKGHYWDTGIEE